MGHHLQALNIRDFSLWIKDGNAHTWYTFETLKCSFASVSRSSGNNHNILTASTNCICVFASNAHQAREHLKCNVFEGRCWTMEELKQPIISDSRNRRNGLGVPLSAICTFNTVIQLLRRVVIKQSRKHVVSCGLKVLGANLYKIKGFLANRILDVETAVGSNSLQNGLFSRDGMIRASCAVICDGHETTNL